MSEKLINIWTPEQLASMNEQSFIIEMLDMIHLSPSVSNDDAIVAAMKARLAWVEAALK